MFTPITSVDQWVQLTQTQLDKSLRLASIGLTGTEKLVQLQLNLAKDVIADQAQTLKSLFDIKDVQSLFTFQNGLAQPSIEKSLAASRSIYETLTELQGQLTQFSEDELQAFNKNFVSTLDNLVKTGPAGSDVAVAAIKSAIAAASTAYESVSKAAKKVSDDLVEAGTVATENAKAAAPRRAAAKPAANA